MQSGFLLWAILTMLVGRGDGVCECGFSVTNPNNLDDTWLFTDMLESNFLHVEDIANDHDWVRQEFNVSAQAGRGRYAKSFMPGNVISSGHGDSSTSEDKGLNGNGTGDGGPGHGLELRVDSDVGNNTVISAEIDTAREDLFYGSYRAGMRLTDVQGTCGAFFWYFNNTQEIDMEFLSQEFDRDTGIYPINLVIQSQASMKAGYDAKATGTFKQVNLTFDPSAAFHEYRFDYVPNRVLFFADSELLAEMQGDAVPSHTGHLILQHWSNGNPLWSGGPPERDAVMRISYMKAYFNTTREAGRGHLKEECGVRDQRCDGGGCGDGGVCVVRSVTAMNASNGGSFFGDGGAGGGESESHSNDDENDGTRLEQDMAQFASLIFTTILGVMVVVGWL